MSDESASKSDGQKEEITASKQNAATDEHCVPSPHSQATPQKPKEQPLVGTGSDAITDAKKPKNKVKNTFCNWRKSWECAKKCGEILFKITEFATFIVVIATTIYIARQWHEMVDASQIANRQLDVMQGQFEEMRKTRQDGERAWIAESEITTSDWPNKSSGLAYEIHFKNSGLTPAIDVEVSQYSWNNL